MKYQTLRTSAIVLAMGLSSYGAFAAANASDFASAYAVPGWSTTPANLGFGFGAWTITAVNNLNPPYSGTYLDLATYGNPDAVVDGDPSSAWGTYANGGPDPVTGLNDGALDMSRAFTTGGGSVSLVNQTFSVAFGSSGIGNGGTGQTINLSVGTAFSLGYDGNGPDNMTLSVDGGTAIPIPVNYANLAAGINLALQVTGAVNSHSEAYNLMISPFAGGPMIYSTSGTYNASIYNTANFSFQDNNTSANQYLNDLSITAAVPEPASMVMLGFAGLTSLLAIRRRK